MHRRHDGHVEGVEALARLVGDPELRFIRRHSGSVGAVRHLLLVVRIDGEDAVNHTALFQIDHVHPDVLPETDVGDRIVAVDRKSVV